MVYNNADQLISWPGVHGTPSVAGYTYYDDGSLHQVLDDEGSQVERTYTYTPDGLLDTASYGQTTLASRCIGSSIPDTLGLSGSGTSFPKHPKPGRRRNLSRRPDQDSPLAEKRQHGGTR